MIRRAILSVALAGVALGSSPAAAMPDTPARPFDRWLDAGDFTGAVHCVIAERHAACRLLDRSGSQTASWEAWWLAGQEPGFFTFGPGRDVGRAVVTLPAGCALPSGPHRSGTVVTAATGCVALRWSDALSPIPTPGPGYSQAFEIGAV